MSRKIALWVLFACLLPGVIYAQSSVPSKSAAPTLASIIAGARREGRLDLVWSESSMGGFKGTAALEKLINQKYGLNLKFNFTAGPDMTLMATKVLQENKAGVAATSDVYLGNGALFAPLYKADVLLPVEWRNLFPYFPEKAVELGGRALWVWSGDRGIDYNTNLVAPADVPKNTTDIFNPKWKGKIASTPYAAGFDRWADMIGEEKVDAFMEVFAKEYVRGLIRCAGEEERVARGEFAMLVFNCSNNEVLLLKEAGAPIDYVIPRDAAMLSPFYMAVPKHAAHPNAAMLYLAALQTKEGQDIIWNFSRSGSHFVKDSKYSLWFEKEFKDVKNIKIFTAEYLVEHGDRLQKILSKYRAMLLGGKK
ncbi:MAG TPA: ABC transporter substrate-binding protein [bacterium]|nr:ABC transporter substrate-binding protein [bacterium]